MSLSLSQLLLELNGPKRVQGMWLGLQRLELQSCCSLLQDRVFQADRAWPGGDLILPAEGVPPTPQRPPSLHGELRGGCGDGSCCVVH